MDQFGALVEFDARGMVEQVAVRPGGEMVFDQRRGGALAQRDVVAQVGGDIDAAGAAGEDHVQGHRRPRAGREDERTPSRASAALRSANTASAPEWRDCACAATGAALPAVGVSARCAWCASKRTPAGSADRSDSVSETMPSTKHEPRRGNAGQQRGIQRGRGSGRREPARCQRAQRRVFPALGALRRQAALLRARQRFARIRPVGEREGAECLEQRNGQGAHGATRSFTQA
jgi:hypothetical protein